MDLGKKSKNVFAAVSILIFISTSEPVTGHIISTEDPIVKAANSTFHIHDEVEAHKSFLKQSNTRKKYLTQTSSTLV